MPATYAHYRFGKLLLPNLPADVRQCIQRFRRMYDLGLQGPDFFFFYNPFVRTATVKLGSVFHHQTGREFFPVACKAATSDAARAYLYGLLGHYCLDSTCHPFINRLVQIEEAGHIPLESEFERFLLTLDGETSPATYNTGRHLRMTRGECMSISEFYPGSTGGKVFRGFRFMSLFAGFLCHPNRARQRKILEKIKPSLCDYMIPPEENEDLAPYIRELHDLYGQALERYPALLEQVIRHLQTGGEFGEAFTPDFG